MMKRSGKCLDVKKGLIKIIENKSSLPVGNDTEGHLEECSECRRLVEDFDRLWHALLTPPEIQPSPSFLFRVIGGIEKSKTCDRGIKSRRVIWQPLFRTAAVASLIILGVLAGAFLGHRPSSLSPGAFSKLPAEEATLQYTRQYFGSFVEFPTNSFGEAYLRIILQEKDKKP